MKPLEAYCKEQTEAELHDMIKHVNDKYRWERTEASYVMLKAAIKELKHRKLIVQSG